MLYLFIAIFSAKKSIARYAPNNNKVKTILLIERYAQFVIYGCLIWCFFIKHKGSKVSSCPTSEWPGAHCVAGSFDWCKRSQIIDLEKKGFPSYVMDQEKPCIQVYEWYARLSSIH